MEKKSSSEISFNSSTKKGKYRKWTVLGQTQENVETAVS